MKPPAIQSLLQLLLALCAAPILAQSPKATPSLEGTWKWTFTMPDGSQVSPRLELKQQAGQLIGTTRFRPGADTAITNLTINGSDVSFEVVRERDSQLVL